MAEGSAIDDEQAADRFRQLGDPTRVAIVAALARAEYDGGGGMSFAELRKRTGVEDSGRFNYHLDKLQPTYIFAGEDGYQLRHAGREAYGVIVAGSHDEPPHERSAPTDRTCLLCSSSLTARYENDVLSLQCPEHDRIANLPLPPTVAADASFDTLLELADAHTNAVIEYTRSLTCRDCWGPLSVQFARPPEEVGMIKGEVIIANAVCDRCDSSYSVPLRRFAIADPAVVSFHFDRGIAVGRDGVFGFDDRLSIVATKLSDDPPNARLAFEADGAVLVVAIDANLDIDIVDRRRSVPDW